MAEKDLDSPEEYEIMNTATFGVDGLLERRDFPCCVRLVTRDHNVMGCPWKLVALGPRVERIAVLRNISTGATTHVSETMAGKFDERHCVLVGDLRLGSLVLGGVAEVANLQPQLRPQYVRAVDFWAGDDEESVTDSIVKDDVFRVTSVQDGPKTTGQKYVEWQRLRLPLQGAMGIDLQSVASEPTRLPLSAKCKFSTGLSPEPQTLSQLAALSCAGKLQLPLNIMPVGSVALDSSREDHCQLVGFKSVTWLIVYSISSMYTKPGLYRISKNSDTPLEEMPMDAQEINNAMAFLLSQGSLSAITDIGNLLGATSPSHDLSHAGGGSAVVLPPVCMDADDGGGESPPRLPQKIPLTATPPEGDSSGDEAYDHPYEFIEGRRAAVRAARQPTLDSDSDSETQRTPRKSVSDNRLPQASPFLMLARTAAPKTPGSSMRYGTMPGNRSSQAEAWNPGKRELPAPPLKEDNKPQTRPGSPSAPAPSTSPTPGKWSADRITTPRAAPTAGIEIREQQARLLENRPARAIKPAMTLPTRRRVDKETVVISGSMSLPQPLNTTDTSTLHISRRDGKITPSKSQSRRKSDTYEPSSGGPHGYVHFLQGSVPPQFPPPTKENPDQITRSLPHRHEEQAQRSSVHSVQEEQKQARNRDRQTDAGSDVDYDSCEELHQDSVNGVGRVLRRNGLGYYENVFRTHSVDSFKFSSLTNSALMDEFGIDDASDRIKILQLQSHNPDDC